MHCDYLYKSHPAWMLKHSVWSEHIRTILHLHVLSIDSTGVGRTGVFLALSIVLERMKCEGVVDMFQTVRMLRTQRPGMVHSEDQYRFCYNAALEYLSSFDLYSTWFPCACVRGRMCVGVNRRRESIHKEANTHTHPSMHTCIPADRWINTNKHTNKHNVRHRDEQTITPCEYIHTHIHVFPSLPARGLPPFSIL